MTLRSRKFITSHSWLPSAISRAHFLWMVAILGFAHCDMSRVVHADDRDAFFEQNIRPVLIEKCIQCHGESKQEGNLRLDSMEGILKGGDSGSAIDTDTPNASLLLEAIRYESFEMPPTGQLDANKIKHFELWTKNGAVWPENVEPLRSNSGTISEADKEWWAFQPITDPRPPEGKIAGARNSIDRFVRTKLEEHNITPAPEASKTTLARRLFFDLIGLPPSEQELDRFLSDDSSGAYEALVDRLLDDPRYGEHWARFWLDLVRYAESDGWNQDAYRPHIWRYRDYVVQSFNDDKPYPLFVREQLAGDEIDEDNPAHLIATGFLRLGIYEYNQRDARGHWNDIMNEMTDVAGDVFLGLSMACARCHDHKFDPIPQVDYFKLRAFFEPISWRDDLVAADAKRKKKYEEELARWEAATESIRAQIDSLIEPYYTKKWESTVDKFPLDIQACFHMPIPERTSWQNQMAYLVSRQFMEEGGGPLKNMSKADKAKHEELKKALKKFDDVKPKPLPEIMAATDFEGMSSPTCVQDDSARQPIAPGYLTVLESPTPADERSATLLKLEHKSTLQRHSTGRRSALAKWIGSSTNPISNRVIVNRVWQQHFGQGLVSTPSDFGTQGEEPSHPQLLDWLTSRFIEDGARLKSLHKRIVMSATWRQSSQNSNAGEYASIDPAEKLLWRAPVRRLQAEQIRDAMLTASGELDLKKGGPSVEEKSPRRALYVKSYRNKNDNFLHGFDMANGLKSVPVRDRTTTPTQALLLINGEYALGRAKAMAKRIANSSLDNDDVLRRAFLLAWNRVPNTEDIARAREFLRVESGEESQTSIQEEQLADFCHVLLNSNQFLYVE